MERPRPVVILALCAVLMALTWFVFIFLLDLLIPLVSWNL
jgi:hypothetical protein